MEGKRLLGVGYWAGVGIFGLLCGLFCWGAWVKSDGTYFKIALAGMAWVGLTAVWGCRAGLRLAALDDEARHAGGDRIRSVCHTGLVTAFVGMVGMSFFLPALRTAQASADRVEARNAIHGAVRALNAYKTRTGAYPDLKGNALWQALVQAGDLPAGFDCVAYDGNPIATAVGGVLPGNIPWVWERKDPRLSKDAQACVSPGRWVVFLDGSLQAMDEPSFEAMMKKGSK